MVMVGSDLAGIELRLLAHYLAKYDGGKYADIILNGDIHQENADKIGITRKEVKTLTYAFLYGAGDKKIGTSFDGSLGEIEAARKGKEIRKAMLTPLKGFPISFRRLNGLRKEVMSVDSTVVISALTKGTPPSTTSYRDRQRRSRSDG